MFHRPLYAITAVSPNCVPAGVNLLSNP
jgi:hypothetical protein